MEFVPYIANVGRHACTQTQFSLSFCLKRSLINEPFSEERYARQVIDRSVENSEFSD